MSSKKPLDPAIRTLLLFFGMVTFFLGLGYESWVVFAGSPKDDGIEVPLLEAVLPENTLSDQTENGMDLRGGFDPDRVRNLEIAVETVAALLPGEHRGPGILQILSHIGNQKSPFLLRFVSGPEEGRTVDSRLLPHPSRAEITGLSLGVHLVRIENPETARSTMRSLFIQKGEVNHWDLDWNRLSSLQGRVFDEEGLPIADAEITLGAHRTQTDRSGKFVLDGIPAGPRQPIIISARDHASRFELLDLHLGPNRGFRFPLLPGYTLRGRIHFTKRPSESKLPFRLTLLPDFPLSSFPRDFPFFWKGHYADIPLSSDGSFILRGLPLHASLQLGILGSRLGHSKGYPLPPAYRARTRVFHIAPDSYPLLSGRVLGPAAKPLVGAKLVAAPTFPGALWGQELRRASQALLPGWVDSLGGCLAVTDAAGGYSLGIPAKRSEIHVSHPAYLGQRWIARSRSRRRLHRDFVLQPGILPSGSFTAQSQAPTLILSFPLASPRPALNLRLRIDGEIRETTRGWDPANPFRLQLGSPALLQIRIKDLDQGRDLLSFQARVLGETTHSIGW